MRVLLTGSTGRLGGAFLHLWRKVAGYEVQTLTRQDVDLKRPDVLRDYLLEQGFDVLVNPAAMSGLEECLDDPAGAEAVNVESPRVMAEVCKLKDAKMVHFSTDYVFGGKQQRRRSESDVPGPVNVYGTTKLAGERAVFNANDKALICRVSWLFGPTTPERPSHFDQVLNRAMAGDEQLLIADKFSMPTYTHDLVEWVTLLLQRESSGLYHLCNAGEPESWHSYAYQVCQLANKHGYKFDLSKLAPGSIHEADFFREARPVHTAMLPARLISEGVAEPRHWLEAAEVYLKIR